MELKPSILSELESRSKKKKEEISRKTGYKQPQVSEKGNSIQNCTETVIRSILQERILQSPIWINIYMDQL